MPAEILCLPWQIIGSKAIFLPLGESDAETLVRRNKLLSSEDSE